MRSSNMEILPYVSCALSCLLVLIPWFTLALADVAFYTPLCRAIARCRGAPSVLVDVLGDGRALNDDFF